MKGPPKSHAERDAEILRLRESGLKYRELGARFSLSVQRVASILSVQRGLACCYCATYGPEIRRLCSNRSCPNRKLREVAS